jgi:Tol biopolymer transport system component
VPDVFLSYSREDQPVARRYAEELEREGFSVWWDQALNPGEAFDQVTEEALAAAHAVIVLWSKHSVSSRWVRAEATQANAAGRLLPVMIEDCTRPIMFELTHTADLTRWRGNKEDPTWQGFVASVRRFLHKRAAVGSNEPVLLAADPPRSTMQTRFVPTGRALRAAAVGTGVLLRRHAGRLALALACLAIGAAIAWTLRPQPAAPVVTRFSIELPTAGGLTRPVADSVSTFLRPALSPDGRRVVYPVFRSGTETQLWSRRLDQDDATPIPGSEGAVSPFFSPDSKSVGFFTGQPSAQLKVFDFGGSALRAVADTGELIQAPAVWDDQGRIFFSKNSTRDVWELAGTGDIPKSFAAPDKNHSRIIASDALPGGEWILLTGRNAGTSGGLDVLVQNVATAERRVLLKDAYDARYVATGHLVFARGGALYAIAFDARRLTTHGREVRVLDGVANSDASGAGAFSLGSNGTLAYVPGDAFTRADSSSPTMAVVRVSRTGETRQLSSELRNYYNPRVSPDGSKIALEVLGPDGTTHIWTMDARTGTAAQLTFEGEDSFPIWTADSRAVLFTSKRNDRYSIWRKAADGTGDALHVVDGVSDALQCTDVRGNTLVFQDITGANNRDIFTLDLAAGGRPKPLLANPADEWGARISPDGHWMAYMEAPTGGASAEYRVNVRPFPNAITGRRAITEAGAAWVPKWSPAGDAIYFINAGLGGDAAGIYATSITTTPTTLTPLGRRKVLDVSDFEVRINHGRLGSVYDVSPKDGDIIAIKSGTSPVPATDEISAASATLHPRLNVVEGWGEELQRLVPVH